MAAAASDSDDTLDLDPEWGGEDLAETIETAFDFKITPEEAAQLNTLGDVHALILRHVRAQPGRCATSMAFYRLRKALSPDKKLSPNTSLTPFVGSSAKVFRRRLEDETGLNLPPMAGGWLAVAGFAVLFVAVLFLIGGAIGQWWFSGAAAVLAFGLSVLLFRIDPQALPATCRTLGGLARETAARSFGKLAAEGSSVDEADVWSTLAKLLVEDCEVDPKRIRPSATLFAPEAARG